MTAAKPATEDRVLEALQAQSDRTVAEIAEAVGLGRSTVGKALAQLEESGRVRRSAGRRRVGCAPSKKQSMLIGACL